MEKKQDSFFLKSNKQQNGNKAEQKEKNHFNKKKQHEHSDKNRVEKEANNDDKKPFDKKAYRLKKYSKKYKLDQWEEQRKKRLLRNLQKDLKNDEMAGTYKPVAFGEDVIDGQESVGKFVRHPDLIEKENAVARRKPFLNAKEKQEKIKQDKLEKQKQVQRAIEEKKKRMEEYRKKKQEKFKKLSKKNKKGQPVMTGRLELLLEKIQKN